MRLRMQHWVLLALATASLAAPSISFPGEGTQTVLKDSARLAQAYGSGANESLGVGRDAFFEAKKDREKWNSGGLEWIKQDGLLYEYVSNPNSPRYGLRTTEPQLCDPSVQQYSGYLDIAEDKHLFFWFFESRTAPEDAPLILWLNGGPGGSSSLGLLTELGPCNVVDGGLETAFNPHSWTNSANIIFLDQPVNVGFSYADNGTTVSTSPIAGEDVDAFLQLFLRRYKKYAKLPFHIAAESYGGVYAPNFASVIHRANKASLASRSNNSPSSTSRTHINLASVILANGLTNPYVQFASVADYACDGPYFIYPPDGPECASFRQKIPVCQQLIKTCYEDDTDAACGTAMGYCGRELIDPFIETGLNPYDVRRTCDRAPEKDGPLCIKEMEWVDVWMNIPSNKIALGVDPSRTFSSVNFEVNQAFTVNGDGARNTARLLPELIEDGVRLLVYAGNTDAMCNFIGNERWLEVLDTSFSDEFKNAQHLPWIVDESGRHAGEVRSAGGEGFTAGNVTYVNVYEAGHMVPYDQPEAALDLITRWITDTPLSFGY